MNQSHPQTHRLSDADLWVYMVEQAMRFTDSEEVDLDYFIVAIAAGTEYLGVDHIPAEVRALCQKVQQALEDSQRIVQADPEHGDWAFRWKLAVPGDPPRCAKPKALEKRL